VKLKIAGYNTPVGHHNEDKTTKQAPKYRPLGQRIPGRPKKRMETANGNIYIYVGVFVKKCKENY
jgi:hypothetical protein